MKRRYQLATLVALGMTTAIHTTFAEQLTGPTVRLNVKAKLNKDQETDKSESSKRSSRNSTETLFYQLEIQASNTSNKDATFDLEWYFIKRPLDKEGEKGDPMVCEKGKTSLPIAGQKRILHQVQSKALINSESKSSKSSSKKSSGSKGSKSSKSFSGDTFGGYVVLVRHQGEILAKTSNEVKFTTEEWLAKLAAPIQSGPDRKTSSPKKKGTKKKGKKKN